MLCGKSNEYLRPRGRYRTMSEAGMSMNEVVVWFAPGAVLGSKESAEDRTRREEEHQFIELTLHELGLQTALSEDLEDLRLMLSKVEPVLLLTELYDAGGWEGWEIIADLRERGVFLPVVVISGGNSEGEVVAAFEAGGNEYLKKPLHAGEFKCRVMNLLWLTGHRRGHETRLKVDGLVLDPSRRLVSRDGNSLTLTPKEFDLLYYLAVHLGEICPRGEILKHVWGYHFQADTNVVDVYIRHIRLKVDKGHRNKLIHTVRGTGYVLRAPEGVETD